MCANELLALLLVVVACQAQQPTWPLSCNLTLYPGMYPRVQLPYTSLTPGTESQCRDLCSGDPRCGLYEWWISEGYCDLFQSSIQLMAEVMGVEEGQLMYSSSLINFGSRKCEGLDHGHHHCHDYPVQYDNKELGFQHRMLDVDSFQTIFSPGQCQALCSAYTLCRSVTHRAGSTSSYCRLYSTTITELLETGMESDVTNYTGADTVATHERYCGEVPYDPSFTEMTTTSTETTAFTTTTTLLDCNDLSLFSLHGTTLCLEIGEGDESLCLSLPGCCYIHPGIILPVSLCVKRNSLM